MGNKGYSSCEPEQKKQKAVICVRMIRLGQELYLLQERDLRTPTTQMGDNPTSPISLLPQSILPLTLREDIIPVSPLVSAPLIAHLSSSLSLLLSGGSPSAR